MLRCPGSPGFPSKFACPLLASSRSRKCRAQITLCATPTTVMPRRWAASCLLLLAASTEALQASRPVLRTVRAAPPPAVAMGLKPADASADKPSARPFPVASLALGTLLAFAPSAAHAVEPALGSTGLLAAGAQAVGGVVAGGDFVPSFSLIFLSEIGARTRTRTRTRPQIRPRPQSRPRTQTKGSALAAVPLGPNPNPNPNPNPTLALTLNPNANPNASPHANPNLDLGETALTLALPVALSLTLTLT